MRRTLAFVLLSSFATAQAQDYAPHGERDRSAALATRTQRALEGVALGRRFLTSGDRVSASAYFRDAISADPSCAEAYVALGDLQIARGALRDAEETFRVGMARSLPDARLWTGLVRVLDAQGHSEDAEALLRDATARFRGDESVLLARRDRAEARLAWSLALSLTRRLAYAAEERGDREQADMHRTHALALRVLVGEVDPVAAADANASLVRRALPR